MSSLGVFLLFLAGIVGYTALLWRVLNRRAPVREIAPRAAMQHLTATQLRPTR